PRHPAGPRGGGPPPSGAGARGVRALRRRGVQPRGDRGADRGVRGDVEVAVAPCPDADAGVPGAMRDEMSHEWTLARLSEALDGTLPAEERTRVEDHLAVCRACSEVRDDLVKLTSAARELGPLEPTRDLWPAIEARLERRGAAGS